MKLSIITINLNNAVGLRKTIESVIYQSYTDFEYIVIDGASTDDSVEVIRTYSDDICSWVSEPDSGIYNAMNKGIHIAQGEYCLFLNSGDWILDTHALSRFMAQVDNEDIVTIHYGDDIYDGIKLTHDFSFYLFYKVSFVHFNTLIRRSLFDIVGMYNEENKIVSDWEFFLLAIFKYNCSVKVIRAVFAKNELPGISLTQMDLQKRERMQVLNKYFPYFIDDYKELVRLRSSGALQIYDKWRAKRFFVFLHSVFLRIYIR